MWTGHRWILPQVVFAGGLGRRPGSPFVFCFLFSSLTRSLLPSLSSPSFLLRTSLFLILLLCVGSGNFSVSPEDTGPGRREEGVTDAPRLGPTGRAVRPRKRGPPCPNSDPTVL